MEKLELWKRSWMDSGFWRNGGWLLGDGPFLTAPVVPTRAFQEEDGEMVLGDRMGE